MDNFKKLIESFSFRIKSIFTFNNTFWNNILQFLLLLIFGIPFLFVEIIGFIFSVFSYLPFIGIIFNFTVCLICDILSSVLFYLIMLPNRSKLISIENKKYKHRLNLTESDYQDINNAISLCMGEVNEEIQTVLEKYKDKLFLGTISGFEARSLQNIFVNISSILRDPFLISKLEVAIKILDKNIYVN